MTKYYTPPNSRNKKYYKKNKKEAYGYCNDCGKQIYVKDFKTIPDPDGVVKWLHLCKKCFEKMQKSEV